MSPQWISHWFLVLRKKANSIASVVRPGRPCNLGYGILSCVCYNWRCRRMFYHRICSCRVWSPCERSCETCTWCGLRNPWCKLNTQKVSRSLEYELEACGSSFSVSLWRICHTLDSWRVCVVNGCVPSRSPCEGRTWGTGRTNMYPRYGHLWRISILFELSQLMMLLIGLITWVLASICFVLPKHLVKNGCFYEMMFYNVGKKQTRMRFVARPWLSPWNGRSSCDIEAASPKSPCHSPHRSPCSCSLHSRSEVFCPVKKM